MKIYSVVKKEFVNIPDANIKKVVRKGRTFAVGKYTHKGKTYEAWKILGKGK
jgi:hypothetical protein